MNEKLHLNMITFALIVLYTDCVVYRRIIYIIDITLIFTFITFNTSLTVLEFPYIFVSVVLHSFLILLLMCILQ